MQAKMIATRCSGTEMRPISSTIRVSSERASPDVTKSTLNTRRVRTSHDSGSMTRASGIPTSIQRAKSISTPYVSCMNAASSAFGGVPTSVASPPIDAA